MTHITSIAFDADDTLWESECYFHSTGEWFSRLLSNYTEHAQIDAYMQDVQKRNIAHYGFGVKSYTLSLIETAIDITEGKIDAVAIRQILEMGQEMLTCPIETMPHVYETLELLAKNYKLILITKGDLFHQERKVAASGLGEFFSGVEIVSHKDAASYQRIFEVHKLDIRQSVMVGNSLKSDILPMLDSGGYGVYIPHNYTWVYEHAEEPQSHARFHKLEHIGQLPALIKGFCNVTV